MGTDAVQAGLQRLALSLDSLLINGVTIGLSPLPAGRTFIASRVEQTNGDVDGLSSLGCPGPASEWVDSAKGHIKGIGHALVGLADRKNGVGNDVAALTGALRSHYSALTQMIRDLERHYHIPKSFYETRPADAARRIDDMLQGLDEFCADEQSLSKQPEAPKAIT